MISISKIIKATFSKGRSVSLKPNIQQHRLKYIQIKDNLQNMKYTEADNIVNQLDNQVDRLNLMEYARYLNNKVVIEFQLRKYGQTSLALRNSLLYFDMTQQGPQLNRDMKSLLLLQQLVLQFVYNRQKQQKTIRTLQSRCLSIDQIMLDIKVKYYISLGHINQGRINQGIDHLISILNNQSYRSTSLDQIQVQTIKYYQQLTFLSLITVKILFMESTIIQSNQQTAAIKFVKNFVNKVNLSRQQLQQSNPFIIYDQYNQYKSMFPQQYANHKSLAMKLDALIGEKLLLLKDYNGMYRQLQKVEGTIFQPWLKAQKFLDQQQLDQALSQFQKVVQHQNIGPEYDILKYEAIKYTADIMRGTNSQGAEDMLEQAEQFRLGMRIEKGSQHLPYLLLPFDDLLGLKEMIV